MEASEPPFVKMKVTGPSSAVMLEEQPAPTMSKRDFVENQNPTLTAMVATTAELKRELAKPRKRKGATPTASLAVVNSCYERLRALKSNFDSEHDVMMKYVQRMAEGKDPVAVAKQPETVTVDQDVQTVPDTKAQKATQAAPVKKNKVVQAIPASVDHGVQAAVDDAPRVVVEATPVKQAKKVVLAETPKVVAIPETVLAADQDDGDDDTGYTPVVSKAKQKKKDATLASAKSRRAMPTPQASSRDARRAGKVQGGQSQVGHGLPHFPGKPRNILRLYKV